MTKAYDKAMPIAYPIRVKEGPAKILTVIECKIKSKRLILKLLHGTTQDIPATKGMVIK